MCPKDAKISLLSISFCYALSLSLSVFVCCLCNTRAVHPRFAWFLLCCSWVQKLIKLFQPSLLFSRGQFFSGFKWFLNGSKKVTLPVTSWTKSRTNLGQFLLRLALITGYFRFFFFFFLKVFIPWFIPYLYARSYLFFPLPVLSSPGVRLSYLSVFAGSLVTALAVACSRYTTLQNERKVYLSRFQKHLNSMKDFKVDIMRHIVDFCLFPFLFSIIQVYNSIKIAVFPIVSFAIFSGIFSGKDISRLDLCTGGILLRYHTGIH